MMEKTMKEERTRPTLFGEVVLDAMRERQIADASEIGLDRLDLKALRRHLDGDRALHRHWLVKNVADALDADAKEKRRMSCAWIGGPFAEAAGLEVA